MLIIEKRKFYGYNPLEETYGKTRKILEELKDSGVYESGTYRPLTSNPAPCFISD